MPQGQGYGYGGRGGGRGYNSGYQYQQPAATQYESFFNPIPIEFLQQNLQQHQGQYDQAFAGALAAKEAAQQQEIALDDQIYSKQLIDNSMKEMDALADQYGGDYGRASKEIARSVTNLRGNEFWASSKHLKEQQALQQKTQLEHPDMWITGNVMNKGAANIDPETGEFLGIRTPDELTFRGIKHGDWEGSVKNLASLITPDKEALGLTDADIDGMLQYGSLTHIDDKKITKILENPAVVRKFLADNSDFKEAFDAGLHYTQYDTVEDAAKDYISGGLDPLEFDQVARSYTKTPTAGAGSTTRLPITGEPKLIRADSRGFPISEDTLKTRREGTINQVLKGAAATSDHMQGVIDQDPERYQAFKDNAAKITEEFKAQGINLGEDAETLVPFLVNRVVNEDGYDMVDMMQDLTSEGFLEIGSVTEDVVGGTTNVGTYTPKGSTEEIDRIDMGVRMNEVLQSDAFQSLIGEKDYINALSGEETFVSDVFLPATGTDASDYMVDFFNNQIVGIKSIGDVQAAGMEVWKDEGQKAYGGTKTAENRRARNIVEEMSGLTAAERDEYRIGILPGDVNDPPRLVINTPDGDQLRMPMIRKDKDRERPVPLLEMGIRDNAYRRLVSDMETPELINSDIDYSVEQFLNKVSSDKGVPLNKIMGGGSEAPGTIYRKGPGQYEYIAEDEDGNTIARFRGSTPSNLFSQLQIGNDLTYLQSIASKYATPTQKQSAALSGITGELQQLRAALGGQ